MTEIISNSKKNRQENNPFANNYKERFAPEIQFVERIEVSESELIKIFVNDIKNLKELSSAACKVFEIMYIEFSKDSKKDKIRMSYSCINKTIVKICNSTFYRGINELLESGFISNAESLNMYWLNPDFFFKFHEISFDKKYRISKT